MPSGCLLKRDRPQRLLVSAVMPSMPSNQLHLCQTGSQSPAASDNSMTCLCRTPRRAGCSFCGVWGGGGAAPPPPAGGGTRPRGGTKLNCLVGAGRRDFVCVGGGAAEAGPPPTPPHLAAV